ncbi:hypothetical protein PoB_004058700 [Plakobranchus ocellatus]|uniref:Uncharacterized protein n=1 Tax=Plakobranchus ocellatus TaxID=259542 RepID=A0AAV4B4F2_9GAST|nr:hypothetical protein PoB_004058700 [Plakobranchus ocellatus]
MRFDIEVKLDDNIRSKAVMSRRRVGGRWHSGYRDRPEIRRDPSVTSSSSDDTRPDGGPLSLRSPCCGLAIYNKPAVMSLAG